MKVTEDVALALTNLRASADFRVVVGWLKLDELAELNRCVDLEGVALLRAQGAVKKLRELLQLYEDAPAVTEKFRSAKRG